MNNPNDRRSNATDAGALHYDHQAQEVVVTIETLGEVYDKLEGLTWEIEVDQENNVYVSAHGDKAIRVRLKVGHTMHMPEALRYAQGLAMELIDVTMEEMGRRGVDSIYGIGKPASEPTEDGEA